MGHSESFEESFCSYFHSKRSFVFTQDDEWVILSLAKNLSFDTSIVGDPSLSLRMTLF